MTNRIRDFGKRSTTPLWWWIASVALIAAGVLLVVFVPRGPAVGPSIPSPIGNTSLTPTQLGATSGQESTGTSVARVNGSSTTMQSTKSESSMAPTAISASLVSYVATPRVAGSTDSVQSSVPPLRVAHAKSAVAARPAAASRPVHLSIPALGVSVSVGVLGLNPDHTVQVPTNFAQPGWYKFGSAPGQLGSTVILGHVDSYRGPAVFFRIKDLRPGDRIFVRSANGKTYKYSVIGVRMYLKSKFPDYLVYGPRPYSALQLVSCGGVFDHRAGSYLSNIVVFTALVK